MWFRVCSLLFLGIIFGWGVFSFFFREARPIYPYSRNQLKEIAAYISERGQAARVIRYNRSSESLLWGNPYFDRPVIDRKIINKMEYDTGRNHKTHKKKPGDILDQIKYARQEGGGAFYIHAIDRDESFVVGWDVLSPGGDEKWPVAKIEWVNKELGEEAVISQLPGIDEVYFLYVQKISGVSTGER